MKRGRKMSSLTRMSEGSVFGLARCWSYEGSFLTGSKLTRLAMLDFRSWWRGSSLCLSGDWAKRKVVYLKQKDTI